MDAAARRQILADLGIVPWQLRAGPGDGAAAAAPPAPEPSRQRMAPEPAAEEPAGRAAQTAVGAPDRPASGTERRAAGASAPDPSSGSSGGAVSAAEEPAADPFSVLSLVSGDTLLLVDGSASRRDLRLAMDVLGAASGDVAGKPVSRRFDWPPAEGGIGIHAGAGAARRALAAFVDKDLADHAVRRVLHTPDVAARWPADSTGVARIELPALASLGQDPAAKRELWRRLRSGT